MMLGKRMGIYKLIFHPDKTRLWYVGRPSREGNLLYGHPSLNLGLKKVEDCVATVTINHPPANTLNDALLAQLESTLHALEMHDGVKVIVITGAGRFFIAGANIHMLKGMSSSQQSQELALTGQRIFNTIDSRLRKNRSTIKMRSDTI